MTTLVFDWAWADAYHRHDLHYYPKLVNAVPFSPIESRKLLTKEPTEKLLQFIYHQLPNICEQVHAQSWHSLFISTVEQKTLQQENTLLRLGCQYHWFNRNYTNFDDFLNTFTSRKRKNLKKERLKITEHGITHLRLTGKEISNQQLDQFFEFYRLTYLKRGRESYLNKQFFYLLRDLLPEQLLLVLALKDSQPVAAALSLQDSKTLYGRYWGCHEEYDSLHFETCYYQGIEYCIENNLQSFNSGAQGEHKIQRGFEPIQTWSAHWIKEQGFNQAIEQFVDDERNALEARIEQLKDYLPFKNPC